MFRRTFSFWRDLVAAPQHKTGPSHADEDRRIWVRYPAQVETVVQHTQHYNQERFSATIHDISLGGARFEIAYPLAEGNMVTLDLPTTQGVESVLACVVRSVPIVAGRWEVGCVFSQELSHEELESMGAKNEQSDDSDQRKWVRFSCDIGAAFYRIDEDESDSRTANVLNVSANGVGLLVDEEIENGTLLNIELQNESGQAAQSILACVVHVLPKDDGRWALGCNFIRELSENDLLALR